MNLLNCNTSSKQLFTFLENSSKASEMGTTHNALLQ